MSGTRLVYGDGLDDLKDCFTGTFGLGRGGGGGGGGEGGSSTRSSRQRVYGGDHYVHPHHLRDSNQGCCDCLGDFFSGGFGESCSKSRLGMTLLFLWVIILTIVCIALGSNIAYSSNNALSDRLDEHHSDHSSKISTHALLLNDLDKSHQRTAGRVENVASQVGSLKTDVNHMEGRLRGEVKSKLEDVRSVLLTALDKATKNLKEIQEDVKKGIV